MDAPRHAFEIRISIGAETWPLAVYEMRRLADHIEEHGPECNMASGGAGSCSSVHVEKRDVSPEKYRAELEEWMNSRKKADTSLRSG